MGIFDKIREGLKKTRDNISGQITQMVNSFTKIDEELFEELEELLVMGDVGVNTAGFICDRLRQRIKEKGITDPSLIMGELKAIVSDMLQGDNELHISTKPSIILVIGVNGVGKTTTIAKLAHRARMQGKKVMIAAADTFRAAAIEQLQVWAERVGALFHARPAGSDPASVAYEAMDRALAEKVDILFVDTAGRLQTKVNLMEELTKIRQVLGKKHEGAPHRCILVIDATTGQNALSQAKLFKEAAGVDELILTKLDGTAKGGVAIAVAMQEKLPITYVGLGEKLEDLRPFNGADYARALLGDLDQGK